MFVEADGGKACVRRVFGISARLSRHEKRTREVGRTTMLTLHEAFAPPAVAVR